MQCANRLPLLSATHACYASPGLSSRRTLLALTMQDVLLCLSTLHRDGRRRRVALLPVLLPILQAGISLTEDAPFTIICREDTSCTGPSL